MPHFSARYWLAALLLGLCLPAYAHHHAQQTPAAAQCQQASPHCAATLTLKADRQGNLWRLFAVDHYLYVQQRLDNGHFAPPLRVNAHPEPILAAGEQRPQLAFGPNGQLYVAWAASMEKAWSCRTRFARAADGQHFSKPITINHDTRPMTHCFGVMQTNPRGDVFIAWLDRRDHADAQAKGQPFDGMSLYYNYSTDNGVSFQTHDIQLATQTCECCRLAMTIGAHGLPMIALRKIYSGSIRDHALVTFTAIDRPLPPQRISFDNWQLNGCPEQGPALLAHQGNWQLLWFDKGRLHYRHAWMANGKRYASQPVLVGAPGAEHPSLAATPTDLYRAWRAWGDGATRIWLQHSQDHGQSWSQPRTIAATQGASDYPELAAAKGKVWLSWLTADAGAQLLSVTPKAFR